MNLAADVLQARPSSTASSRRCSIVFGVALVGVLVEAFVAARGPLRSSRWCWRWSACSAALVAVVLVALHADADTATAAASIAVEGAIAVDGPALFIWGTLLVLSLISVLLFAERTSRAASPRSPARPRRCPAPRPSARRPPRASSTPRSSR